MIRENFTSFVLLALSVLSACKKESKKPQEPLYKTVAHTDSQGFHYETVTGDPTGLRLYTLKNGLKVYLARNTDEPKIQTYVAVRAGSVYDPADNTGLAHYLEHMMFKGTEQIATQNWKKEAPLLKELSALFEKHKVESDPKKKRALYQQIDRVSQKAAHYSIANEYDKLVNALGVEENNAHTSFEETVYQDKIPSNELDKWLRIQGARFKDVVLRLFHTELEAVYEEFNRRQDNDDNQAYESLLRALFPTHPYGQQTTIGKPAHLKNPSMVAIHRYFDSYYVPDNTAIVLVGDLDFDRSIQAVNRYFGSYVKRGMQFPKRPEEKPMTSVVTREVTGASPAKVYIGFRTGGIKSAQRKYVRLIDMLLSNSSAGLIDLNLNQTHKLQYAGCYPMFMNDYGVHTFVGIPKAGQSLEAVKDLILEQVDKVKKGEFPDWMIRAVVNDLKLYELQDQDKATATAKQFYRAFIHFQAWADRLKALDEMRKVTKAELVQFARDFYRDNYVVVYKRHGKNPDLVKVKSPPITPVPLNRGKHSAYFNRFMALPEKPLQPQFVNYAEKLHRDTLKDGLPMAFVANEKNDLCTLDFVFDMGADNDKKLALALDYLSYLGTEKRSPKQIRLAFYKLGMRYSMKVERDRMRIELSGLRENLAEGLALLEDFIRHARADKQTYKAYIQKIAKDRADTKALKKSILMKGLVSYAKYGENSPLRDVYSIRALKRMNPDALADLIKGLMHYKHRVFYYGKDRSQAVAALERYHKVPAHWKSHPAAKHYAEVETGGKVYWVNYDMVQAELFFLAKDAAFSPENMAAAAVFNRYFGTELSSIFFQEIRESKALAYSAYALYRNAQKRGVSNYMTAYVGTQVDKMPRSIDAALALLNHMPHSEKQFLQAKEGVLKQIASHRITKEKVFWSYEALKKRGLDEDYEEKVYHAVQKLRWADLKAFFNQHVKGKRYTLVLIGNKKDFDLKALSKLGEVKQLDVDYLFHFDKVGSAALPVKH